MYTFELVALQLSFSLFFFLSLIHNPTCFISLIPLTILRSFMLYKLALFNNKRNIVLLFVFVFVFVSINIFVFILRSIKANIYHWHLIFGFVNHKWIEALFFSIQMTFYFYYRFAITFPLILKLGFFILKYQPEIKVLQTEHHLLHLILKENGFK